MDHQMVPQGQRFGATYFLSVFCHFTGILPFLLEFHDFLWNIVILLEYGILQEPYFFFKISSFFFAEQNPHRTTFLSSTGLLGFSTHGIDVCKKTG